MKGNLKYKLILVLAFSLFVLLEIFKPRPTDWSVTLDPGDEIPYGTYAFGELLPGLFSEDSLTISRNTIYQIYQEDDTQNLIVTGKILDVSEEDLNALTWALEGGSHVLLIVEDLNRSMADSLELNFNYKLFIGESIQSHQDSVSLSLDGKDYQFPDVFINSSISPFSSGFEIISRTDDGKIIFIEKTVGEGKLYICTLPLLMTNYSLLKGENVGVMESLVSRLPDGKTTWTSLYSSGKAESTTILRYLLSEPSLRWAYGLSIISLLLFMIFRLKREQRQIPTIKPPENSSVNFAVTVGQLYKNKGNHKDIAMKRLTYLKDFLARSFFINVNYTSDEIEKVSHKTGKDEKVVAELYRQIDMVHRMPYLDRGQLIRFNEKLEDFYNN